MKEEARKTMRVAVYCRLARADQEDTLLEVQKERLRVYAKERGYDVVAEIAEIGSGLSLNRPGIREMAVARFEPNRVHWQNLRVHVRCLFLPLRGGWPTAT